MAHLENERLQQLAAAQWERERQMRADAYAAALTHIKAAMAALTGSGDQHAPRMVTDLSFHAGNARGSLRRVLDERSPFAK